MGGKVCLPLTPPYPSDWTQVGSVHGNANVYSFTTEEEMHLFCNETGVVESTMFQQSPAL